MKITKVQVTPVSVPVTAPLRYSTGADAGIHRLIVEVHTDEGLTGLGECNAGVACEARLRELAPRLLGVDPFQTERLRWQIGSPPEVKLFGVANHVLAAIEFACLDIQGQAVGRPVHDLLGGRLRDHIPLIAYLFYRYPNEEGEGAVFDAATMLDHALDVVKHYGFRTLKFKAGVFPPEEECEAIEELRKAFRTHLLRVDPNAAWSLSTALRVASRIQDCDLEYIEDPIWGLRGMRRFNAKCPWIPLASNMAVATPEDFGPALMLDCVDAVLVDPHFYGGLRQARHAAAALEMLNVDVALHSQGELGVSMAAQLHLAASLPSLPHAADAHYHHLIDDVIEGGKLPHERGGISVPTRPGLGVNLDPDRMAKYHELALKMQTAEQTSIGGDPRALNHLPVLPKW